MKSIKEGKNQTTNGNGKKQSLPKTDRLPKDYEPDESEAAQAFMKAVGMMRKRLEQTKERAKRV